MIQLTKILSYGDKVAAGGCFMRFICFISMICWLQPVSAQSFIVTNMADFKRVDEVIALRGKFFSQVKNHLYPVATIRNKLLISQLIDDHTKLAELLVEISLGPHEKDTIKVSWVKKEQQKDFAKTANVQLSLRSDTDIPSPELKHAIRSRGFAQNIAKPYYQMEGPGIENDKVAFRAFFDSRNSKDIYGKIIAVPVLEKVGVGAGWHELQSWGMDIFHTGNSLGAGGLAVKEDGKIFRLGDADTSVFDALYEGALGASFKLCFKNWDIGTTKKNGAETISMVKGDFFYKDIIQAALNKDQSLIAGIANFGIDKVVYKKQNAALSSVSIYGNQAEGTGTKLGVAILFSSSEYIGNYNTDSTSIIPNTTCISLRPVHGGKRIMYFFACWEKTDKHFSTQAGFDDYLFRTAQRLANPVLVEVFNKKNL